MSTFLAWAFGLIILGTVIVKWALPALLQFILDLRDVKGQKGSYIVTRVDMVRNKQYFWGTDKETKDAVNHVKNELRRQNIKCRNTYFGGIVVYNKSVSHTVYEHFSKARGFCISNVGLRIGFKLVEAPDFSMPTEEPVCH